MQAEHEKHLRRPASNPFDFGQCRDYFFIAQRIERQDAASETRQILVNLKQLLEASGSSLDKVVKVNVLLRSMLEAPNMNEVYARFFPEPPPARTVCGARLPDDAKVIIECTALV